MSSIENKSEGADARKRQRGERSHRLELARVRMKRLRERNRVERLPMTHDIDSAIRDGVVLTIASMGFRTRVETLRHPVVGPIIRGAFNRLRAHGFNVDDRKAIIRVMRRFGLIAD